MYSTSTKGTRILEKYLEVLGHLMGEAVEAPRIIAGRRLFIRLLSLMMGYPLTSVTDFHRCSWTPNPSCDS